MALKHSIEEKMPSHVMKILFKKSNGRRDMIGGNVWTYQIVRLGLFLLQEIFFKSEGN